MTFDLHRSVEVLVCFSPEGRAEYPHWLLSLQSSGATECAPFHWWPKPGTRLWVQHPSQKARREFRYSILESPGLCLPGGWEWGHRYSQVHCAPAMPDACGGSGCRVGKEWPATRRLDSSSHRSSSDVTEIERPSPNHPVPKPAIAYTKKDRDNFYDCRWAYMKGWGRLWLPAETVLRDRNLILLEISKRCCPWCL